MSNRTHWHDVMKQGDKLLPTGMPLEGKIIVTYESDDGTEYNGESITQVSKSGFIPIPEAGPDLGENGVPSKADFYALGRSLARSVGNLNR